MEFVANNKGEYVKKGQNTADKYSKESMDNYPKGIIDVQVIQL